LILEDIEAKLKEIDPNVFYGMVDNSMRETQWNYIVFARDGIRASTNKTGFSYVFNVSIIRENFIPEGLEVDVINKMQEISGIRFSQNEASYEYIEKPNTNIVIEMVTLQFVKPLKA
jgi:hypothetical protein